MERRAGRIWSYRELVVWQRAMELVSECYAIGRRFPPVERYGLCSQLNRAAVSIAANIAGGFGRTHTLEHLQFISIAQASPCESETLIEIARRIGYVTACEIAEANKLCLEVGRMLTGVRTALKAAPKRSG